MGEVTFLSMPSLILVPGDYIEQDNSKLAGAVLTGRPRVLLIGQKLAGGAAAVATLLRVDTPGQAKVLFGQGSMLADMVAGYKSRDTTIETWAMAVADDAGGTAATGSYAFTGPATAAGTFKGLVCGQRVPVAVTSGMTATQLATALAAAVNANADLPVTATSSIGTVTITARHKGVEGSSLQLAYNYDPGDALPAGIALTLTAMSGGAVNPSVTAAIAAIRDAPFAHVVHGWSDSTTITAFEAFAADRSGPTKMNYSEVYAAKVDTYSNHITALASRNSPWGVYLCLKASLPRPAWRVLAELVACIAPSAADDPALPFNTLLVDDLPPAEGDWFIWGERELLLEAGGATLKLDGGGILVDRVVTTSKTNSAGQTDAGQRDLNTVLTVNYMSISARTWLGTQFVTETGQPYKIVDDASIYPPGAHVTDCRQIKAALIGLASGDWKDRGLIENLAAFKTSLVVERNANDATVVDWRINPNLVNGLHVRRGQVQSVL